MNCKYINQCYWTNFLNNRSSSHSLHKTPEILIRTEPDCYFSEMDSQRNISKYEPDPIVSLVFIISNLTIPTPKLKKMNWVIYAAIHDV